MSPKYIFISQSTHSCPALNLTVVVLPVYILQFMCLQTYTIQVTACRVGRNSRFDTTLSSPSRLFRAIKSCIAHVLFAHGRAYGRFSTIVSTSHGKLRGYDFETPNTSWRPW